MHQTISSRHVTDYRPDLDGLRAVAVLGVVAYHAFPSVAPGGFLGLISYELYLVHWPAISFATILAGDTPSIATRAAIVLLSILGA
jgi:peptidoglycan/LPS O-acetylase OafA/YrhL